MPKNTQIVVIGGGIVGCAAAYYLAKRGIAVTLFEKGTVAGEQSSRNWGFVRQQGRDPAELPLMMECNALWQGLEQELGADLGWRQDGNLRVMTEESQVGPYQAWMEIAKNHGLDTQLLEARDTRRLLPGLVTPVLGALFTRSDGQANPARVAPAFAHAAGRLGADVVSNCAVNAIETSGGKISGVATEQGFIRCEAAVCAAGAWSSRLTRSLGLRIPQLWLRASVGYTGNGEPLTGCGVWMPGVAFRQGLDGGFNIAYGGRYKHDLTLDSFRFFGDFLGCYKKYRKAIGVTLDHNLFHDVSGNLDTFSRHRVLNPRPVRRNLRDALANFKSSFPQYDYLDFERTWAGYIDATPDMLPIIDRVERPAGLVLATGFSGHGFGLGPISGLLASRLALEEQPGHDLRAFRYSRFQEGCKVKPGNVL